MGNFRTTKTKSERKYSGIAKVGYDHSLKQPICVKYRFNKVDNFILFIQNKFPSVCWINIYNRVGEDKNKLAFTWGKIKGLRGGY